MDMHEIEARKIRLMRVAAWGQAIGFLAMAGFLMADPSSISLEGADFTSLLVIFAAAGALSVPRMAKFIARAFSSISISLFALAISFATLIIAIASVSLDFSIPPELVTPAWQYTRTASLITFGIYLVAFVANAGLSIRLLRADRALHATPEQH